MKRICQELFTLILVQPHDDDGSSATTLYRLPGNFGQINFERSIICMCVHASNDFSSMRKY